MTVDGRWLTIRAERSATSERAEGDWLVRERSHVSVLRRVTLGPDVDVDRIEATSDDGVLSVTIWERWPNSYWHFRNGEGGF